MLTNTCMRVFVATYVASVVILSAAAEGNQLGDFIKDFSPLFYDSVELHKRHSVTKRSIYDKVVSLQLSHAGRKLDLSLFPYEDGTFHPNAKISTDGIESNFDTSHLYSGYVKGDPKSSVTGSIIGGVFQGVIKTGINEIYHVDRKEYHPSHPLTLHKQVHSVVYRAGDVDVEKFNRVRREKRSAEGSGFCGSHADSLYQKMEAVEDSMTPDAQSGRKKRATPDNHVCNMFLQSDPEMWKYFANKLPQADPPMIKQEITALFRELVKEVNGIYTTSDFSGRSGFKLRVDRIAVNQSCDINTENHWFCNEDLDVSNFLNLNTYTNHDAYCLAYIFTSRDFADGTLGLAWVAKPGSLNGGICSSYQKYNENGSPRDKSLNTGIVTIKNYGQRVPKLMSQLTFAHEVGHNFGSEHDSTDDTRDCTPYTTNDDDKGNYIMYYAAISGQRENNIKFSPCSRASIGSVLANSRSTRCFKEPTDGHCGNQIVDGQEKCDCGYKEDCPKPNAGDCCKCCVGQDNTNNVQNACTLTSGSSCDPSQGPCCAASSCQFQSSSSDIMCSAKTECAKASYCDGTTAACPVATFVADNTFCHDNTLVCNRGECNKSVCSKIDGGQWTDCSLPADGSVSAENLCKISCMDPTTKTCYSSGDVDNLPQAFKDMLNDANSSASGINVKPGYPCDKDQGFCDYFLTCRKINELGPLARLKGILLKLTSIEELTKWLKEYWWVVLLAVLGLVGFTFLLVKFGAKFTPSSNPDKKPHRRLSKPTQKPPRRHDAAEEPLQAAGPHIGERRRDEIEMR